MKVRGAMGSNASKAKFVKAHLEWRLTERKKKKKKRKAQECRKETKKKEERNQHF